MALQSFRLVDCHDVGRIVRADCHRLPAQRSLPMLQKVRHVRAVLIHIGQHLVEKGIEIGRLSHALRLGLWQREEAHQPLTQFVERQFQPHLTPCN